MTLLPRARFGAINVTASPGEDKSGSAEMIAYQRYAIAMRQRRPNSRSRNQPSMRHWWMAIAVRKFRA
jgi:hypothetical protein